MSRLRIMRLQWLCEHLGCAPSWIDEQQPKPTDGLYIVRNGVAVAVTAEELAKALYALDRDWGSLPERSQAHFVADAQKVLRRFAALTRPADGASE